MLDVQEVTGSSPVVSTEKTLHLREESVFARFFCSKNPAHLHEAKRAG